jgi:hypothetical protein
MDGINRYDWRLKQHSLYPLQLSGFEMSLKFRIVKFHQQRSIWRNWLSTLGVCCNDLQDLALSTFRDGVTIRVILYGEKNDRFLSYFHSITHTEVTD